MSLPRVTVTIVLLSAATVLAEGTGESKPKEWSHGPYDKLQPEQTPSATTIIPKETNGSTTNGSRTNLVDHVKQGGTNETTRTNAVAPTKPELRTK